MRRRVTQQTLRLADVRLRMAHVAGPESPVNGLLDRQRNILPAQDVRDELKELVERLLFANSDVVSLIDRCGFRVHGRQQIRLRHIFNKTKITAGVKIIQYGK